jgi:hypothetical protein
MPSRCARGSSDLAERVWVTTLNSPTLTTFLTPVFPTQPGGTRTQALGEMTQYPSGLERTAVTAYAVGDLGLIVKSTDDGVTWSALTVPISSSLYSLACPTANVCWAVGDNGRILKVKPPAHDTGLAQRTGPWTRHDAHTLSRRT